MKLITHFLYEVAGFLFFFKVGRLADISSVRQHTNLSLHLIKTKHKKANPYKYELAFPKYSFSHYDFASSSGSLTLLNLEGVIPVAFLKSDDKTCKLS